MTKINLSINDYDMANIFNAYEDKGFQFFNLHNTIYVDPNIDPVLYTTHLYSETDDWYSLSNRYYKTPRLWWVILIANQIVNPFDVLRAGTPLKILNGQVVSDIITQINKKK